ncbi:restriction endonuclease subunit S [Lactiplantibacillus plantarum]|uniref:restriction endonuclease subunit S n=1 Tax=Lactiplantibacillus plantarum TaxID=1590 RepID=UPI0018C51964|nr:restriction endonuclease subunit S [Lactiplantibacillus plantarum]MBG1238188.1 restriction endonuclease subunit S [Lactiplantibacillus plantarum subsp. plantarum]
MKVRTLIPNIRFRGFSDPWEQRKLQQIAKVFDGTHQTPEYVSNGVPFVSVENIKTLKTNKYISNNAFQNNFKIFPQKGDIFMTRIGNIGSVNIVENNKDLAYYVSLALIRPEHIRTQYLAQYISSQNGQRQLWRRTLHVAFPKKINKNEISKINIFYPDNVEQEKIGSLIIKLDHLIAANEDKVQQLKTLKKLMMQKIFSQEWRFKGFTDPWEQRKLESVVIVYDKGRVPVTSTERISGDTPYYGANGIQDYVDGYTHDGEFTLIAEDGANDTRNYPIKFVSGKIWVNNHAHVLAGKQNILNTRFLSFSLQQINIEPFLSGSGRAKLNASEMKKLLIAVPNIYEQIKVENFLGEMAHLIAANEDKLNQLKRLKKYLMQNLFV